METRLIFSNSTDDSTVPLRCIASTISPSTPINTGIIIAAMGSMS